MNKIKISSSLSLPLDVVTQTVAVLAKRRAGKSYTMRRIVEQLFNCGQQVVLVDPKGDQWGVRYAADGKAAGLSIIILGGERGDVPLEANSGEIVAKLVVEERVSAVLDLSLFRKNEVATFMTGFLENLYRMKAREQYRTPMMLVMDEADAIAPQKPYKGEEMARFPTVGTSMVLISARGRTALSVACFALVNSASSSLTRFCSRRGFSDLARSMVPAICFLSASISMSAAVCGSARRSPGLGVAPES